MPAPAPASDPVRLSVLGEFHLALHGEPQPVCTAGQRVIAHLAVHSRSRGVRRTHLAEALWCDTPPARAAASLRSVLWRLPRVAGAPLVESSATVVRLADGVSVDLWDAEALAEAPGALPGAADLDDLVRDLLPGWSDDWLVVERESHRQTRLHALEQLCAALRGAGRHAAALRAGLAAVQCEPLRETAHRQVIEVHLAEGNHAEALRQYQAFRRLLADELGLAPSGGIRALVSPLLGRPVDVVVSARSAVVPTPDAVVTPR